MKNIEKLQPTIPKLAADYIDWSKKQSTMSLKDMLAFNTQLSESEKYKIDNKSELTNAERLKHLKDTFNYVTNNEEKMARAWLYGYKLKDKNYIEITHEEEWHLDPVVELGVPVRFIGERPDPEVSFSFLSSLHEMETGERLTYKEALNNTFKSNEKVEIYKEFIELYPDYKGTLKTFEDITDELAFELFEYVITETEDIQKMMEANDFQMGTVGRSQWTHYIMPNRITNYNLPLDMWEGYNFYTVSLLDIDKDGKYLGYKESLHFVYAPDIEEIFTTITDMFGLTKEDIHLVNNDITQHLLNFNKVNKSTKTYYHPE